MRAQSARRTLVLALVSSLSLALLAQEGRFGDTASVTVVEVPVYVLRDGKPVRGLTAADFEVLDGKTRRPITGFEVVDLAAAAPPTAAAPTAPAAPLPLAGRRHFLLLFDLTFAEPSSILKARRAAQELVRTSMHPADLVAVATYSNTEGAKLVLGFTPDREQVAAAIESLGLARSLSFRSDPLALMIEELEARRDRWGTLSYDDELLLAHLEESRRGVDSGHLALVNEVGALTRSFTELAQAMAAVGGRKFVVYLSEGFEAALTTGQGMDAETARAVTQGEVWRVGSERVYGSTRVQNDLANMLAALRRADCIVQAVDIGGVRAGGPSAAGGELASERDLGSRGRDSLLTLARGTGGALYEGFNDLAAAMGKMLDRTSVTYLLAFQPDDLVHDGAFHPITVRLKGAAARGARVHHRAGYYAPDPRRSPGPLEQRLAVAADLLSGAEGGNLPLAALAVPLPGSGLQRAVPLLLEVDGPALLAGHSKAPSADPPSPRLTLEIYAYALDRQQAVRGFLTQRLELDLDKVEDELRASGLKFYGELELPPGSYTLRLLVQDSLPGGARALRSIPLEVPAAAGPLLSPPLFLESAGGWLLTRQAERPGETPREDPFTLAGRPLVPDLRPMVAAGGEARVALLVSSPGGGKVVARSEVLRAGDLQPAAGGGFRLVDRQRGAAGAPDRLVGVFSAAGLAPGEYLLRVTLTDRASGASHAIATPFVVAANAG